MTKTIKDLRKKVFTEDFKKFCKENFNSQMEKVENVRIFYLIGASIVFLIMITFAVTFIYYLGGKEISKADVELFALVELAFYGLARWIIKCYKNRAKKIILKKLLSYVGDFELIDKKTYSEKYSNDDVNYFKELELFSSFNIYNCDDRLTGTYKNLKLDIIEAHLERESGSGKRRRVVTVFKGLLVKVPFNKKIKSSTIVLGDKAFPSCKGEKVNLEDPEFEKYFDVYSTDQIEARYLLTTAFMDRIVKIMQKRILGSSLKFSFEKDMLNIAISSSKDWFEIPILEPATKLTNYRGIILEIITILSIIEALKLDEKTGL